jgi:PPOX class probable F420-dependent enzyme
MHQSIRQFKDQEYINLETYRKNGTGVKTPVWFVEDNARLYVRTVADSWKVKRIKNHSQVKVVPCKSQGQPIGDWVTASAQQLKNPVREQAINKQLNQKYGILKYMFDLMGKVRRHQMITLEISFIDLESK